MTAICRIIGVGNYTPAIARSLRELAEDLLTWRKLRGLTQAQLADRAGVSRDTLSRLESGDGGVSIETLLRVLRALGLLDGLTQALDPYETDVGRLRSDERLPQRVRPRRPDGQERWLRPRSRSSSSRSPARTSSPAGSGRTVGAASESATFATTTEYLAPAGPTSSIPRCRSLSGPQQTPAGRRSSAPSPTAHPIAGGGG